MRGVQALLLVLAACDQVFGVSPPTGFDGSPSVDTDQDGTFDDADNCRELANPSQHDEDSDDFGDACDPCPHLPGTDADTDGDGVGNGCDPNVDIGNERLAVFDAFELPRSYPCASNSFEGFNCNTPESMVEVVDDALAMVGPTQFLVENYQQTALIRTLEVAVRLTPTTPDLNYARVIARSTTETTTHFVACGVMRNATTGAVDAALSYYRNGQQASETAQLSAWPPPERVVIRLDVPADANTTTATCHVSSPSATQVATIVLPLIERPATYGVWAYEMTAAFEYLALVVGR